MTLFSAQAQTADDEIAAGNYKGLLHGIPYGIKDMYATKNYPTTYGTPPYKNQVIDEDATVIKKLRDAGAVLIAKLSLGELAMDDVWFGGLNSFPIHRLRCNRFETKLRQGKQARCNGIKLDNG